LDDFRAAFEALPTATFRGTANGRKYLVSKTRQVGGQSQKLIAEQLDGPDNISLNFYRIAAGWHLRPCEMPSAKVIAFVLALRPDQ
jgi:hypothetical protein